MLEYLFFGKVCGYVFAPAKKGELVKQVLAPENLRKEGLRITSSRKRFVATINEWEEIMFSDFQRDQDVKVSIQDQLGHFFHHERLRNYEKEISILANVLEANLPIASFKGTVEYMNPLYNCPLSSTYGRHTLYQDCMYTFIRNQGFLPNTLLYYIRIK
jgi:hypothetical protein